jgi:hypothetical protein
VFVVFNGGLMEEEEEAGGFEIEDELLGGLEEDD